MARAMLLTTKRSSQTGYVPVKRDTTMLYRYAASGVTYTTARWRAWRIKLQNPGTWVMHCHILAHMIMSLLSDFSSNFLETIAGVVTAEMQTGWMFGNAVDIVGQVPEPYLSGSAYGTRRVSPTVTHYHSLIWITPPNLKFFWGHAQLSNGCLKGFVPQ